MLFDLNKKETVIVMDGEENECRIYTSDKTMYEILDAEQDKVHDKGYEVKVKGTYDGAKRLIDYIVISGKNGNWCCGLNHIIDFYESTCSEYAMKKAEEHFYKLQEQAIEEMIAEEKRNK